jgi:hypothetical protein
MRKPPQKLRDTPAEIAGKPSKNHQEPSPIKCAHELSDDWKPIEFSSESESRKVVDGWPPGEFAVQLEMFRAQHGKKGDKFRDWQKAWSTWVLNTRRFGIGRNYERPDTNPTGTALARVMTQRPRLFMDNTRAGGLPDSPLLHRGRCDAFNGPRSCAMCFSNTGMRIGAITHQPPLSPITRRRTGEDIPGDSPRTRTHGANGSIGSMIFSAIPDTMRDPLFTMSRWIRIGSPTRTKPG